MKILVDKMPAKASECPFIKEVGLICGLSNEDCPLIHGCQCDLLKPLTEAKGRRKFTKPTVEEVRRYCMERRNTVDAQSFVDFYDSKGWLVGKTPMKDWKAAVRTWERSRTTPQTARITRAAEPNFFDD